MTRPTSVVCPVWRRRSLAPTLSSFLFYILAPTVSPQISAGTDWAATDDVRCRTHYTSCRSGGPGNQQFQISGTYGINISVILSERWTREPAVPDFWYVRYQHQWRRSSVMRVISLLAVSCCCWPLLYGVILRSRADWLHSSRARSVSVALLPNETPYGSITD